MADFSDMDVDFDEQLGLEDDHLVGFEDEIYVEPPTEVEADADQVVLPVHVNAEDDLMETTEGQVPQESPSLPTETDIVESPPPKRHRLLQKTTVVASTPPKLCRLHKKTTVSGSPSPQSTSCCEVQLEEEVEWWAQLDHRAKYVWAYNRMNRQGFKEYVAQLKKDSQGSAPVIPGEFSKLNKADKQEVTRYWFQDGSGQFQPKCVARWVTQNFPNPNKEDGKDMVKAGSAARRMRSKQFMFTCQGDWGVLQLPSDLSPSPSLGTFCTQLKALAAVEAVWGRVRQEAGRWHVRLCSKDYTVCLELCARTWQTEKTIRLHAHLAFVAEDRMSMTMSQASKEHFLGSKFQVQQEMAGRRRTLGWGSFYYVQAPKIGHLWDWGTKMAYDDYPVAADWIWNLIQSKKMTLADAKKELVRSSKCLTRHLPNLHKLEEESITLDLEERIREKEAIIEASRCPFKPLKPVFALMEDLRVPRDRRKFLVLDGASRLGKTAYCMSLYGKHATLEVNCMGETSPALQGFRQEQHRCVLFDEAAPDMVLTNRKLFQCPNALVQMAQSKTGCHSYAVYLNDTLLVISSNHWGEALSRLPHSEAAWIEANQVLIRVTRPLWLPKGGKAASSS